MREELTRLGVEEYAPRPMSIAHYKRAKDGDGRVIQLRLAAREKPGQESSRPAHERVQIKLLRFRGRCIEATEKARGYFTAIRPRPLNLLVKDGKPFT